MINGRASLDLKKSKYANEIWYTKMVNSILKIYYVGSPVRQLFNNISTTHQYVQHVLSQNLSLAKIMSCCILSFMININKILRLVSSYCSWMASDCNFHTKIQKNSSANFLN